LPSLRTSLPWTADQLRRESDEGFSVVVKSAHADEAAAFKVSLTFDLGTLTPETAYTLRFRAKASSAYARAGERYAHLPHNLLARLLIGKRFGSSSEVLVFTDARDIVLTVTTPKGRQGRGRLEFGVGEEPGRLTIEDLELRQGCGDVMYRKFRNGLVLLNGSATSDMTFDITELFPGESYRRVKGTQDPEHNSGEPVGKTLTLSARDGIFLVRTDH
jgi:hypothetical protein